MRLLVVKPTALGDVAHALQVVPYLKESGWCDELTWVVDEAYIPLLDCCPCIDEVIAYPRKRWRKKWPVSEIFDWGVDLRHRQYDVTLDLQGLARSALMSLVAGSPRRIGLKSAREFSFLGYTERVNDEACHAVDRYSMACEALSGTCPVPGNYLRVESTEALPSGLIRENFILLHPYSQRDEKCWPWRGYQELVRLFPEEMFVLIGQGKWFPCMGKNVMDLRNQTNLKELIFLIGASKGMMSTDSGPLHMAAAFAKPVVGIYGASLPERTRPRGEQVTYLWDDSFQHEKKSALHNPEISAKAMSVISPAQVAEAWRNLFE